MIRIPGTETDKLFNQISYQIRNGDAVISGQTQEVVGIGQIEEELPALKNIIRRCVLQDVVVDSIPTAQGFNIIKDKLFYDIPTFKCKFVEVNDEPTLDNPNFAFDLATEKRIRVPEQPSLRHDLTLGLLASALLPAETGKAFGEFVYYYKNKFDPISNDLKEAIISNTWNEVMLSLIPDNDPSRLRGTFLLSGIFRYLEQDEARTEARKLMRTLGFEVLDDGTIPREIEIVDRHYALVKKHLSDPTRAISIL